MAFETRQMKRVDLYNREDPWSQNYHDNEDDEMETNSTNITANQPETVKKITKILEQLSCDQTAEIYDSITNILSNDFGLILLANGTIVRESEFNGLIRKLRTDPGLADGLAPLWTLYLLGK